jgi:hypothetical protein
LEEEVKLGLKCRSGLVAVESFQEGVVLNVPDPNRVQVVRKYVGERGLTDANRAFDGEKT